MKVTRLRAVVFGLLLLLSTVSAYAGRATLTLRRTSLTNVDDAAGRWQFEGGAMLKGATVVGQYAVVRRIVNGATTPQNTAMVTMTLFFQSERPPQNITIQGAHDFGTGVYRGSVSAASARYDWVRSATVSGSTTAGTITFEWVGSPTLTLP